MRRAVVIRYKRGDRQAEDLFELVGRESDFGGSNFTWIDHGWVCSTEEETIRVGRALSSVGLVPDVRDEGEF